MTLVKHELKVGFKSTAIWTIAITFFMVVCIFLFPEMKGEMEEVGDVFASMGTFTDAFGMDQLNFGTFVGYYGIECGNVLGLGGAFFAALTGIGMLAKEEKDQTAEFLLTHPVKRSRILTEKLIAAYVQVIILNAVVLGVSALSMLAIGEDIAWKEIMLMHLAYFILQLELVGICFGLSAFLRKGSLGVGLGLATVMYFLNLVSNITESAEVLKYVTPFAYTNGADIVSNVELDMVLVAIGMVYMVLGITLGYWKYCKKDIA